MDKYIADQPVPPHLGCLVYSHAFSQTCDFIRVHWPERMESFDCAEGLQLIAEHPGLDSRQINVAFDNLLAKIAQEPGWANGQENVDVKLAFVAYSKPLFDIVEYLIADWEPWEVNQVVNVVAGCISMGIKGGIPSVKQFSVN